MKTILVTGAAGYIGRHVVKKALDMGYRVIASDFAFKGVDERAEFCDVPIFSGDKNIYAALGKPDVCIHLYHIFVFSSYCIFISKLQCTARP